MTMTAREAVLKKYPKASYCIWCKAIVKGRLIRDHQAKTFLGKTWADAARRLHAR